MKVCSQAPLPHGQFHISLVRRGRGKLSHICPAFFSSSLHQSSWPVFQCWCRTSCRIHSVFCGWTNLLRLLLRSHWPGKRITCFSLIVRRQYACNMASFPDYRTPCTLRGNQRCVQWRILLNNANCCKQRVRKRQG